MTVRWLAGTELLSLDNSLGLPVGLEAPVMTPSSVLFLFLSTEASEAGRAVSKEELKGRAMRPELDVKPSAPTSIPLRVRFGDGGTPSGASVPKQAFAQAATASR